MIENVYQDQVIESDIVYSEYETKKPGKEIQTHFVNIVADKTILSVRI